MKKLITILTLSLISSLGWGLDDLSVHHEFLVDLLADAKTQNLKWKLGQTLYYRNQLFYNLQDAQYTSTSITVVNVKSETPIGFWILVTTFSSNSSKYLEKPKFTISSQLLISKKDGSVLEMKINGQPAPVPTPVPNFPELDGPFLKRQTSVDVAGENYPNVTYYAYTDTGAKTKRIGEVKFWEASEIPMPIKILAYDENLELFAKLELLLTSNF